MTPRHLLWIAALTSAFGVSGAAIAQDMDRTTVTGLGGVNESPAAGAIVTPEDKAAGLGKNDAQATNRNGVREDDASSANNDVSVNPGASSDDMAIDPGRSHDDVSVNPGAAPHVPPADMGPGNLRGQ